MTPSQGDLFEARRARDRAIAKVTANNRPWVTKAIEIIRAIPSGAELTGEDIRLRVTAAGIQPEHHNAWGALIRSAVKNRLLMPTGKYLPMTAKKSHARMTPQYRRT